MKLYFIAPTAEDIPSKELLNKLEKNGEVVIIIFKGLLSNIDQLKIDTDEKILALDPTSFDWNLDIEALKAIPKVKAICTSSTNYAWLKSKTVKDMGIVLCNVPGFSSDSVAEYALCMAIEVARRSAMVVKNNWKCSFEQQPMLLKGKTAGIIGLGRIGKRMAELCQGIGMSVIYWSRHTTDDRFTKVAIDDLFSESDVIIPALIENEDTEKIMTHNRLDLIKKSSILVGINKVRTLWDEKYILDKVKNSEIAGYAFEGEDAKEPKYYEGNVWSLPPIAWYTQDSMKNLLRIWVDNVKAASEGNPQNVV